MVLWLLWALFPCWAILLAIFIYKVFEHEQENRIIDNALIIRTSMWLYIILYCMLAFFKSQFSLWDGAYTAHQVHFLSSERAVLQIKQLQGSCSAIVLQTVMKSNREGPGAPGAVPKAFPSEVSLRAKKQREWTHKFQRIDRLLVMSQQPLRMGQQRFWKMLSWSDCDVNTCTYGHGHCHASMDCWELTTSPKEL